MRWITDRTDLFITPRTYWSGAAVFALFVLSYPFPVLFPAAKTALISGGFVAMTDLALLLIWRQPVSAVRRTSDKWSLGDENKVHVELQNRTFLIWTCEIYDELPDELQVRDLVLRALLVPRGSEEREYVVRPLRRGSLKFGKLNVLFKTPLGLLARRTRFDGDQHVAVYPSLLQMKKYSLYSVNEISRYYGVKKMRRIGHSYEFEQIKDYVLGDDMRHINWKATGRTQTLKTNHFIEERSQPVYCVIDKSRNMNLAFDGVSLLDHSINTALVIANTAVQKGDKAGLVTFSDKVGTALRADSGPGALRKILDNLYHQKYRQTEPDFEFLFNALGRVVSTRSLLFLFTNFETLTALDRAMPVIRRLNQKHLLVVILFQNREIENYAYQASENKKEVYHRMIARQMLDDKRQMLHALQMHGVQCILTNSRDLTIDALNKYIELKAKGLI